MADNYSRDACCWMCEANTRTVACSAFDFGTDPEWASRPRSHADYAAKLVAVGLKVPVTGLPGFNIGFARIDLMHSGLLGIVAYAVGASCGSWLLSVFGNPTKTMWASGGAAQPGNSVARRLAFVSGCGCASTRCVLSVMKRLVF